MQVRDEQVDYAQIEYRADSVLVNQDKVHLCILIDEAAR